jgi:hypothetical protein
MKREVCDYEKWLVAMATSKTENESLKGDFARLASNECIARETMLTLASERGETLSEDVTKHNALQNLYRKACIMANRGNREVKYFVDYAMGGKVYAVSEHVVGLNLATVNSYANRLANALESEFFTVPDPASDDCLAQWNAAAAPIIKAKSEERKVAKAKHVALVNEAFTVTGLAARVKALESVLTEFESASIQKILDKAQARADKEQAVKLAEFHARCFATANAKVKVTV